MTRLTRRPIGRLSRTSLIAVTIAAAGTMALALPANASSTNIDGRGGDTAQARCEAAQNSGPGAANAACLYYDHNASTVSGMWSTSGSVRSFSANPAAYVFGHGEGEGQTVWNNATALESEWDADAAVFVNSGYAGDDDYVDENRTGEFTSNLWNNEASIERW